MNPSQPGSSFGSGTSLIGAPASSVLAQPGGLQQQGPNSPSFQPGMMPSPQQFQPPQSMPMQQGVPGAQPVPGQPQMPEQGQGVVGLPPSSQQAVAIINALSSRLKSLSKSEEMQNNPMGMMGR